jgi:energy-coupling factor transporter transmembrane protein EcfT
VFIAIEKADRLGLSMELRGYSSGTRSRLRKLSVTSLDWLFLVSMILLLSLTIWMRTQGMGKILM